MPFLETFFGRKKPTSAAAAAAIAKLESELAAMPGHIAKAQAALKDVADMTDEQHAAVEAELAAARRSETRLAAQIEQVRAAHALAEKTEAAAALRARAIGAQKRVDQEHMPLIGRYEERAAELAEIAAALAAIEEEVRCTNYSIECAHKKDPTGSHPDPVVCSTTRFRTEPDVVEPDVTVTEEKWEEVDPRSGYWVGVGVFGIDKKTGERVPVNVGARKRKVERIIKGTTRKGRALPSPIHGLQLPAARLGGSAFWPRQS